MVIDLIMQQLYAIGCKPGSSLLISAGFRWHLFLKVVFTFTCFCLVFGNGSVFRLMSFVIMKPYTCFQTQRYEAASTIFGRNTLKAYQQQYTMLAERLLAVRKFKSVWFLCNDNVKRRVNFFVSIKILKRWFAICLESDLSAFTLKLV